MSPVTGPSPLNKIAAELVGTFVLTFGGCGSALLAANFPDPKSNSLGIGLLGVALAFGLTVVTMAYAVGHISGGHFNPAVTLGAAAGRRISWAEAPLYIGSQLVGGIIAGGLLYLVATGKDGFSTDFSGAGGFATNGYGDLSPGGYSLLACLVVEFVLTMLFLWVILGTTDTRAPKGMAPLAIGLFLTLIHLVSIPVTNTSVNPARSLGVAVFAGTDHLAQVWLFFIAPIAGALVAGFTYKLLFAQIADGIGLEEAMDA